MCHSAATDENCIVSYSVMETLNTHRIKRLSAIWIVPGGTSAWLMVQYIMGSIEQRITCLKQRNKNPLRRKIHPFEVNSTPTMLMLRDLELQYQARLNQQPITLKGCYEPAGSSLSQLKTGSKTEAMLGSILSIRQHLQICRFHCL